MKKNILFALLLTLTGTFLQAQIKGYIGLQGGGHLSNAYIEHTLYNTYMDITFTPGYQGGLMMQLYTNRSPTSPVNAGLQIGLTYNQKGWKQTFTTDEPSYKVQLDYIELPIEALAYFGRRNLKFFFTVGMYMDYMVQAVKDAMPDTTNLGGAEFYTYDKDRGDHKFGYGVKVSTGFQRDFPIGTFHVDFYGLYTVTSLFNSTDFSNRLPDLSNQWQIGFTVAYLIPFGKMEF